MRDIVAVLTEAAVVAGVVTVDNYNFIPAYYTLFFF